MGMPVVRAISGRLTRLVSGRVGSMGSVWPVDSVDSVDSGDSDGCGGCVGLWGSRASLGSGLGLVWLCVFVSEVGWVFLVGVGGVTGGRGVGQGVGFLQEECVGPVGHTKKRDRGAYAKDEREEHLLLPFLHALTTTFLLLRFHVGSHRRSDSFLKRGGANEGTLGEILGGNNARLWEEQE